MAPHVPRGLMSGLSASGCDRREPACVSGQQEEFEKAMRWYESTLKLHPEFAPAKDRLKSIQCYLLTKRDRRQP